MSIEEFALAMTTVHRSQGKNYWLRERNVVCPNCLDREQIIVECPIADAPSARYSPHDSRYLMAVGSRRDYQQFEVFSRHRH